MEHHMLPIRPHPRSLCHNDPITDPSLSRSSPAPYSRPRGRTISHSIKNMDPEQPRSIIENIKPEDRAGISSANPLPVQLGFGSSKSLPFLHSGVFCPMQPQEQVPERFHPTEQPF